MIGKSRVGKKKLCAVCLVALALVIPLGLSGHLMYQSNYASGLRILDVSDAVNPLEVGFFDSVPWTDAPGFEGSWSNYPFFASGVIVFTSRNEGLFVVKGR